MRSNRVLALVSWIILTSIAAAQQPAPSAPKSPQPAKAEERPSLAEQIARLEKAIEQDERLLSELRAKLATLQSEEQEPATTGPSGEQPSAEAKEPSEYASAKAQFMQLDDELTAARKQLETLESSEDQRGQAGELKSGIEDLEKRWKLAKERFDLAIQERKATQEQIAALEEKLKRQREQLQKLNSPATQPATQPAEPSPAPPAAAPAAPDPATPAAPAVAPTPVMPGTPSAAPAPPAKAAEDSKEPPDRKVQETQREVELKQQEAQQAEQQLQSISEQIGQLDKSLANQRELLEIATGKMTNARETEQVLLEQLQAMSAGEADPQKLRDLSSQLSGTRARRWDTQREIDRIREEIQRLQSEKARLESERASAETEAERVRMEAEKLQKEFAWLQNPFAPRNMLRWVVAKGPAVVGILIGMFVLLSIVKLLMRRVVGTLYKRVEHLSPVERENRAQTLVSVLQNAASIVIIVGGVLMILQVLDVPVAPVLGGAAVVGLAVAFGAQNLIQDYFYGFMILLENQYGVNDVVKIGGIGGLVERVTLRVTVLRDLEGVAHFIPNGQIKTVSNMTYRWSRALFDIGVAYKEDVDQVMSVLMEIGRQMRHDAQFGHLILDYPEMLGVNEFSDSAIVIRFFIKTRPLQQWTVKREMLRRIKNRFDELGIEIPFPHRTVYHRTEGGSDAGTSLSPLSQER